MKDRPDAHAITSAGLDDAPEQPNLRHQAYQAFTDRLLSRAYKPGQFITQRELVTSTGFSLAAIRELIPRLEAEGLIRTIPQRGLQIAQVDLSLVREAFQFRLLIEQAAIAHFVRHAADSAIVRIREAHEAILGRLDSETSADLVTDAQMVDWGFHDEIVASLGNEIIWNAYRVNSIKIRLIRQSLTKLERDLVEPVMRDHLRVIVALSARDAAGAAAALAQHLDSAQRRALGY